ncbi:MAG: AraC family transcriptional regulator [Bacillota bacterium]|nr:AraC family transcriptional regulator [Bacillota bacterium]
MESATIGRYYYKGYILELSCNLDEKTASLNKSDSIYRFILVEEGKGIIKVGDYRQFVIAPSVLCMNEKDKAEWTESIGLKTKSVNFHPRVINNKFDFDMGYDNSNSSESDNQDRWCVRPFVTRDSKFVGIYNIDYTTSNRLSSIISTLNNELLEQKDENWPCRSRTYLLELLFIAGRAYDFYKDQNDFIYQGTSNYLDSTIMYLHMNYNQKITLNDLTSIFHTNKTTLNNYFISTTGLSVMSYLINIRMNVACSMLRNTTLPVSEIYSRTGFKDNGHFGRTFRKVTGYSPLKYRQDNCWMLSN